MYIDFQPKTSEIVDTISHLRIITDVVYHYFLKCFNMGNRIQIGFPTIF